jgi:hypothetical protein
VNEDRYVLFAFAKNKLTKAIHNLQNKNVNKLNQYEIADDFRIARDMLAIVRKGNWIPTSHNGTFRESGIFYLSGYDVNQAPAGVLIRLWNLNIHFHFVLDGTVREYPAHFANTHRPMAGRM